MVSFTNIIEDTRTLKIDINGEWLNVTYKPSTLSPAFMEQMASEVDEDDPNGFAILFCQVIADWDLTGPFPFGDFDFKADEKIPLDPEVVSWIPTGFMRYILTEVGEDSAPKAKKQNKSSRR